MEKNIECKNCGNTISYKPITSNTIIFCSNCKKVMFVEYDYGFSLVTPCYLYYKNEVIGKVFINENEEYVLSSLFLTKNKQLGNRYLEALEEATSILGKLIINSEI